MSAKSIFRSEPFRLERGPWKTVDPFLFCVYHKDRFPKALPGKDQMGPHPDHKRGRQMGSDFSYKDGFSYYHGETIPGFPSHPHRGLSTITITLNNSSYVDHFDSTGAHGRYGKGDTQWMVAGGAAPGGITHAELFPLTDEENENVLELFQIWLKIENRNVDNTGQFYKMFWNEEIPVAKIPVEGKPDLFSEVKVVVGDYPWNLPFKPPTPPEADYAADPKSQATIYIAQLPCTGASIKLPPMLTSTAARSIYLYIADDEGNAKIRIEPSDAEKNGSGGTIRFRQGVKISPDCEVSITNEGSGGNIGVLVLGGEPLAEPTQNYGPFVGKDMSAIEQTFANYRRTNFGGWPWPKSDMTHPKDAPRMSVPSANAPVEYPPGYEAKK